MTWRYLSEPDVVLINELLTGTADLLAAPLLLRSAVARQWAGFGETELYPELHQKAGALFHGLCSDHAFLDGNKRTALVAAETLGILNGAAVEVSEDNAVDLAVRTAAEGLAVEVVIEAFAAIVVT